MKEVEKVEVQNGIYVLYCPWCGNRCERDYTVVFLICEKCGKISRVALTNQPDITLTSRYLGVR